MAVTSTQAWKDEVRKQFRYPGRVKFTIDIMSTVSKADVVAVATNALPITDIQTTLDGNDDAFAQIATFEGVWKADGTMYLPSRTPSENLALPLMSDDMTTPMLLSYTFNAETSFIGLTMLWDETYQSWPTHLIVKGYSSGVETYSFDITDLNEVLTVLDAPMDNVTSITVQIIEWSNPALFNRMTEIYFGVMLTLTNNQIMSIDETTEQDLLCAKLPKDTQKYVIKNQIYRSLPASGATAVATKSSPLTGISRIFNQAAATEGIASIETRYWKADGSLYLPSTIPAENSNIPWMSEDADFSATDPIELIITYEHPVQVNQINWVWDSVTNSWPVDATLVGKDSYANELFSINFSATGPYSSFNNLYSTIKTVHLTIREWSQEGWRARINQYEALLVYGNNNIPSEVNNLFDPTLTLGYSKYLAQRQKVRVRYGLDTANQGTLWLPEQVRFLDSWKIPTDAITVEFQANTRLSFLTQTYTKGAYTASGTTLYNLALSVLQSANVIHDLADPTPWNLASILQSLTTVAPLPSQAENSLLQLIAGAAGCYLGTNPQNGYISIVDTLPDAEYVLDQNVQLQVPSVELQAALKSVQVKMYRYIVDDEVTELFNGTVVLTGTQTVTITFKDSTCATNCSASISGATVVSRVFYGYSAVFRLTVASADTTVSIVVNGYKVESSAVDVTTYQDDTVMSGKEISIDNPLVTNMTLVERVSNAAVARYARRSVAAMEYLGFPDLKAGDRVAMYSQYMNENAHITKHTFKYNGAFSGNVEMLMEV